MTDVRERLKKRFGRGWLRTISTGPGWDDILDWLDRKIAELHPDYEVHQVKEKFGLLRFYTSVDDDPQVQSLVRQAESASGRTCETCGQPGENRVVNGWYTTLCEAHDQ